VEEGIGGAASGLRSGGVKKRSERQGDRRARSPLECANGIVP